MFTENSKIVQDYVLLIQHGLKTIDDVPNHENLREVVSNVLAG
ncbi:CD1375 family protein [Paenibacillus thermotolerans]|nr:MULTISPECIES: CD1375 family protein [unclassified Paenibacillus]